MTLALLRCQIREPSEGLLPDLTSGARDRGRTMKSATEPPGAPASGGSFACGA
jgi:hypothetical protein